jgi:hypothetical protein
LRPENWTRPVGAGPVRVIAGEPGSGLRFVDERRRAGWARSTMGSRVDHVTERESDGAVVPDGGIGPPSGKGPGSGHASGAGTRQGMAGTARPNQPGRSSPAVPRGLSPASGPVSFGNVRRLQLRLWAAAVVLCTSRLSSSCPQAGPPVAALKLFAREWAAISAPARRTAGPAPGSATRACTLTGTIRYPRAA